MIFNLRCQPFNLPRFLFFCYTRHLSAAFDLDAKYQELGIVSVDSLTTRVNTSFDAKLSPQQDAVEIRNHEIHIELLHSGSAFSWHVFNTTNLYFQIQ